MKVFLYNFSLYNNSLCITNDNTSHVYDGLTYEACAVEGNEFSFDLKEIMGEVNVLIPFSQAGFLQGFTKRTLEGAVAVKVYEYDVASETATVIFQGFINSFKCQKGMVEFGCISFVEHARDNYPRMVLTRHCNNRLYGDLCGLNSEDYREEVMISRISLNRTSVTVINASHNASGWFTYGYLEKGNEYRFIIDDDWDDVEKAHSIDLLHPLPDGWKGGDTINAYPGCDKTMSTCKDKFENFKHFIGFPYAPYESIRFTGLKGQSVTASKK